MRRLFCAALLFAVAPAVPAAEAPKGRKVDFTREVRPILTRCFQCHGPDDKARKGKLRLDTRAGAVASAIVPGKPDKSELIARVIADDSKVMPPKKAGKKLSDAEVAVLKRWI